MPIGVVTDEDLQKEQDSVTIEELKRGRGNVNEVPTSLRKVIAETAVEDGNKEAQALADAFNISPSSVSAYKNGAHSTASYDEPNPELKAHVDTKKQKIAKSARSTLLSAIKAITKDKLDTAKPRDLAGIAKDMASVVRTMEPEIETVEESVKFVFFAPPMRKPEEFKVIDIVESK